MANYIDLPTNNIYSNGKALTHNGVLEIVYQPVNIEESNKDEIYVVNQGDNLRYLAYNRYGDSNLWWVIAEANKSIIINPLEPIKSGTQIRIPNYNNLQVTLL